jgi:hypothetical protein
MGKIALVLLIFISVQVCGQTPDPEEFADALTDVANGVELIAITSDVVGQTLDSKDRLDNVLNELSSVNRMLQNPNYYKYVSYSRKNNVLTEIGTTSKQIEVYARTLANLIRSLTIVADQIRTINTKSSKIVVEKAIAFVSQQAGSIKVFGTGTDGLANATTVSQLKDNLNSNSRYAVQSQVLAMLVQLDAFNKSIIELENKVRQMKGKVTSSFGVGVLLYGSSTNLYSYIRARNNRIESVVAQAMRQNEAQARQTKYEMDRLSQEFVTRVRANSGKIK